MKTVRVVLTGGPCAGKTEVLKRLVEYFNKKEGHKVFCVSETASEVINGGLKFNEASSVKEFQKVIFNLQLAKEKQFDMGIQNTKKEDTNIIFYDRGLFDNIAYLDSEEDFDEFCIDNQIDKQQYLDRYDMVIDLISLATTNPDQYNLLRGNNKAREEDSKLAKYLDNRATLSWLGHRNIKLVYPTENIDDKVKIVIHYIENLLNGVKEDNYINCHIDDHIPHKYVSFDDIYLKDSQNGIPYKIRRNNDTSYLLSSGDNSISVPINKKLAKALIEMYDVEDLVHGGNIYVFKDGKICREEKIFRHVFEDKNDKVLKRVNKKLEV